MKDSNIIKTRLFSVLVLALLAAACTKIEVTTIYSSFGSTNIAISYESPASEATEVFIHAWGDTPQDTIVVFLNDTTPIGYIVSAPVDLTCQLPSAISSGHKLSFETSANKLLVDLYSGTTVLSEISNTDAYHVSLTATQMYKDNTIICRVRNCNKQPSYQLQDYFVASVAAYNFNATDSIAEITIKASHVGATSLRLFNNDFDTMVSFEVLPVYSSTYREPALDFNDTRDSVISKLGTPSTEGDGYLQYNNFQSFTQLLVYFNNGILSSYIVVFTSEPTSSTVHAEIESFLLERYESFMPNYSTAKLYINAWEYGDATKLISLENTQNRITYYNPLSNPIIQK